MYNEQNFVDCLIPHMYTHIGLSCTHSLHAYAFQVIPPYDNYLFIDCVFFNNYGMSVNACKILKIVTSQCFNVVRMFVES